MQDREQREARKTELIKAIRKARKAMCGETLVIGDHDTVEKHIQKALKAGKTVMENGVCRWIGYKLVYDPTKHGSDAYTWRGDKVKHEKRIMTKQKNGKITCESIGFCYLEWA